MRALALLGAVLLGGCMTIPANPADMSAEQLREWIKDKNANVTCVIANTPYGKGSVVMMTVDRSLIVNGSMTIDDACKITMTNQAKPPGATP